MGFSMAQIGRLNVLKYNMIELLMDFQIESEKEDLGNLMQNSFHQMRKMIPFL